MEDSRFDAFAKALGSQTSRRLTFGALLGGALGLHGVAAAAKSGKCQPKCAECEKCKKGDCDKKNGKKRCKKGKCQPKAAGTACTAFPGGQCLNGSCVNLKTDEANCGSLGTACAANQVCENGACFPASTCPPGQTGLCTPGVVACDAAGATVPCLCSRSAEGNVVCVQFPPGASCTDFPPCTSSATCPPGQACVETGARPGCCAGAQPRACFAPCPNPA